MSRARKTKPVAILYNAECGETYEMTERTEFLNMERQGEETEETAVNHPIDVNEFAAQFPQDFVALETLLRSDQAREILETFDLNNQNQEERISPPPGPFPWLIDHNYAIDPYSVQRSTTVPRDLPPSTVPLDYLESDVSSSKFPKASIKVSFIQDISSLPLEVIEEDNRIIHNKIVASSQQNTSEPDLDSQEYAAAAEAALNIRRSARQQDRFDRQEARRILAENKEMMQKEKEIMSGSSIAKDSSLSDSLEVPKTSTSAAVSPMMVESSRIIVAEHEDILKRQTISTPTTAIPVEVQLLVKEEKSLPKEYLDIGKSPYPKRENRKAPAHLTDPNFTRGGIEEDVKTNPIIENVMIKVESKSKLEFGTEEELDDNDPKKLWCTCRQPHNNRFMICCDRCEDWYHGKCVGMTRAQGKVIEDTKSQWHCPACKRSLKAAASEEKRKSQGKKSLIGSSVISLKRKNPKLKVKRISSEIEEKKKKEKNNITKIIKTPSSNTCETSEINVNKCISCSKPARPVSVYCSNECVIQHSKKTSPSKIIAVPISTTIIPLKPKERRMKLSTRTTQDMEEVENFLTFHLISTKSNSTEILLKEVAKSNSVEVNPSTSHPIEVKTSVSTHSSEERKKQIQKSIDLTFPIPKLKIKSTPPKPSTSNIIVRNEKTRKSSGSDTASLGKKSSGNNSKTMWNDEKKEERSESSMTMLRDNMRKSIRDILLNRIGEGKRKEKETSVRKIAERIERELVSCFGSWNNRKCKNKYRSIIFNLKDPKNGLYLELLNGQLLAKDLVRMEPHQMATAELTEWRTREKEKELEAIHRSEIDKLAEAKKKKLIEAGTEFDKVVSMEQETRSMNIGDVIKLDSKITPFEDKVDVIEQQKKSYTDKDKRQSIKKNNDERSTRQSSRNDDINQNRSSHEYKHKLHIITKKSERTMDLKTAEREKTNLLKEVITTGKRNDGSLESDPELPSSTVKTPEFTESSLKFERHLEENNPILITKLVMPELGQFHAKVFNVSHEKVDGIFFPETPVPIVGRISPDIVWDYIDKMKKNKELIVFRLSPDKQSDESAYMAFFTYLSSRNRFGVLGAIISPLKDVYLIPLDKYQLVNRTLLPFRGPGLPKNREHCLLAVVTRHTVEPKSIKRNTSNGEECDMKRPRISPRTLLKSGQSGKRVPHTNPTTLKSSLSTDDDTPYTPWEEEEKDDDEVMIMSETGKSQAELLLEELTEKIEREKAEIETISVAISSRSESGTKIPGLDGEFNIIQSKDEQAEDELPSFLRDLKGTNLNLLKSSSSPVRIPPGGQGGSNRRNLGSNAGTSFSRKSLPYKSHVSSDRGRGIDSELGSLKSDSQIGERSCKKSDMAERQIDKDSIKIPGLGRN